MPIQCLADRATPHDLSSPSRDFRIIYEAMIAPVQPLEIGGDAPVADGDVSTHIQPMTEVLRQSKTLQLPGNRELTLAGVRRTVDAEYLHAEARTSARAIDREYRSGRI